MYLNENSRSIKLKSDLNKNASKKKEKNIHNEVVKSRLLKRKNDTI
jgi:hypothetical protein